MAIVKLLILHLCMLTATHSSLASVCQSPLGMADKSIHDSQLAVSSSAFSILTSAESGRLNRNDGHGAWCPFQKSSWYREQQAGPFYDQYFQVHLLDPIRISAIGTQGRSHFQGTEMVKRYYVNYTKPYQKAKTWLRYHDWSQKSAKLFKGSGYNVSSVVINRLVPPIMVETIRIIPEIYPINQVCMRLELYGCHLKNDLVSYTMPPGSTRGPYNMTDFLFDGAISTTLLSSGLGQLTDGTLAAPDFRENKGRGWIAWYIKETPSPFIIFNFLKKQIFRSVTIHCNIRSRSDVELFESLKVRFSENGMSYKRSLTHSTDPVTSGYSWQNYNVTVDLCLNTAKAIRLEFAYGGEWMYISEVTFENRPLGIKSPPVPACLPVPSAKFPVSVEPATPDGNSGEPPTNSTVGGKPFKDDREGLNGGVIAGIVCAVLLIFLILIIFVCLRYYRKRRQQNKKPSFYHFIRWELKPFNSNSARRVSRISGDDRGFSLKRFGSHRAEPEHYGGDTANGPIYASIHNLDELGLLPSPPAHDKNDNKDNNKPERSMSRGKSLPKPKSKPPPLPNEAVEDVPEVEYAQPDSPLLSNQSNEGPEGPDYAEPEAPTMSPSHNGPRSPTRSPALRSPPLSPIPPNPDTNAPAEDDTYERPINPLTGYSEPIDSLVFNDIFQNPVYEEIYSEPYQGVSGSTLYANPSTELVRHDTFKEFPRDKLHFREKIGDGQFGEVHLGEAEGLGELLGDEFKNTKRVIVAIKMLKSGVDKNIKQDFFKEVKVMAGVRHENVVRLLGVCRDDPMCMIVEYMVNGDLNQFLKQREMAPGTKGEREKVVTYQALIYMALQLAAGMKYIASLKFVHRDLATRNCLVGHSYTVKIADFGMSRHLYSKHYYRIQGRVILPIRWMAPECILQGKFTTASDVWAFGVTLWEILTLATEYPYGHLPDEKVIENVQLMFFRPDSSSITYLEKPDICPIDVYEKMMSCWAKDPDERPDFDDLHSFLKSRVRLSEMAI